MKRRAFATLCLTLAAVFAALGIWQIERRAWKLDLIARVDARIHAAPITPPSPDEWRDDMAYTRVRATGSYATGRDTLVQAVTERGAGWWVMTPLHTAAGTILVNRGFIPTEQRGRITPPEAPVSVTGLLRVSEPGGGFLRSNAPEADRWYSRDVAALARARGLGGTAPYFIDADATPNASGWPVGGLTVVTFRNTHLIYSITWFALAALSVVGAVIVLRRSGTR